MITNLCKEYGEYIGTYQDQEYYNFPSTKVLSQEGVESKLRSLGFGYRAKYIAQSAQFIQQQPEKWLQNLRGKEYSFVKEELLQLPGVGPKVADCVCMMSMDIPHALPVDTHVWQIALRDYKFKGLDKTKSLTEKNYTKIGDGFRDIFGEYTGWAHSVLFAADLKHLEVYRIDGVSDKILVKEEVDVKEKIKVKAEVKIEVKSEVKSEVKTEIKTEKVFIKEE